MEQKIITDFPSLNFGKKMYNRQLFSEIDALKGHQNPNTSSHRNAEKYFQQQEKGPVQ